MAAGVVSGAAALLLQANPSITPDRAKFALLATARRAASDDPLAVGSGVVDAYAAALATPSGVVNLGLGRSNGHGSVGVSRGTVQTLADDPAGTVLGPVLGSVLTVQLLLWNPLGYTGGGWRESDWYLSTWSVFRFYRVNWYSSDWPGHRWHGSSWYGQGQDESYGTPLPGGAWYGAWD
jgi:serine protease AprX